MRLQPRVVWNEGMHLAQHHFQLQSRYVEDLAGFTLASLFFEPYGIAACELNAEALRNGTASITHARGIMPDGLPFQFPEDPVPEALDIRDLFSPTQDSHLLLLGIPPFRPQQANCALEPDGARREVRFRSSVRAIADDTTGTDEKPIAVAVKNFRLLLDSEPVEELVTLPLARVRRDGSGNFVYDPDYVPPCLQIRASERLMRLLARLTEMLDARAESLASERRLADQAASADYASREVAGFWLSHAIHSALGPLLHHQRTGTAHPEALFMELARLAGALCTFSMSSHPRELPVYEHDQLDRCFDALERHLRDHLEIVLPTSCVTVPLARSDESYFTGTVTDTRCFGGSHWFLGVRSSLPPTELATRVPKLVKVCSEKHIARLVKEAFPGLALEPAASPPAEISPRLDTRYFRIEAAGPCWSSIVDTGRVGVYAPAAVADVELELAIVPAAG